MQTEAASTSPTTSRMPALLPWSVWAGGAVVAGVIGLAPLFFPSLFATSDAGENIALGAFVVTVAIVVMVFATAGLLVTRQQPRNAVGWLMLVGGPALGAVFLGYGVGVSLVETGSDAGSWFVLAGGVLFGPAFYLLGPGLASVFPTGRPLPGWWTRAVWISAAAIGVSTILIALAPGQLEESIAATNPLGIDVLPTGLRAVGNAVMAGALIGGALAAIASLVVRYVRSASEIRHQIKWFLFAGVTWAVVLPVALIVGANWTAIIVLLALGLVPAAVVVAVLRYRLYEIDTLINRTLVYVPLVGIVAGLYAGMVALFQSLFTAVTGNTSDAAAVISALALAAVFTPIRNALQSTVDRRFKPEHPKPGQWEDPEFRAAVEAIVRDVVDRPLR